MAEVKYTCKGPRFSDEEKAKAKEKLEKEKESLQDRLKDLKGRKVVDMTELRRLDARLAEVSKGLGDPFWKHGLRHWCGEDVTALIEAVSADGVDHWAKCPKCGTETRVMMTP